MHPAWDNLAGEHKHFHNHCPQSTCCLDTETSVSVLPSWQASQDSHSHQHNPPNSHHPHLFQSTKINSFIRTFDSVFSTEEEDAQRLLLKAVLFGAQVTIYPLDDEKEKETSTYYSPLEQSMNLFWTCTTAGQSQEVLLKEWRYRKPHFLWHQVPAAFQADCLAGSQRPYSPQAFSSLTHANEWSSPARQHKPWQHLQKSSGQRHFCWNKAKIQLSYTASF